MFSNFKWLNKWCLSVWVCKMKVEIYFVYAQVKYCFKTFANKTFQMFKNYTFASQYSKMNLKSTPLALIAVVLTYIVCNCSYNFTFYCKHNGCYIFRHFWPMHIYLHQHFLQFMTHTSLTMSNDIIPGSIPSPA